MSDVIYQMVYSSAAVRSLSTTALATLLEQARVNNARLGVTGLLLYHQGSFIQALEGPKDVVEELFQKIKRDPRHDTVVELLSRTLEARQFPHWSMGFLDDDGALEKLPGFSDFMREGASQSERSQAAKGLLDAFRLGRFRAGVRSG